MAAFQRPVRRNNQQEEWVSRLDFCCSALFFAFFPVKWSNGNSAKMKNVMFGFQRLWR